MNAKGFLLLLAFCGVAFAIIGLKMCGLELSQYEAKQKKEGERKKHAQTVLNQANQHFARAKPFFNSKLFEKATLEYRTAFEALEASGNLNATNYDDLHAAIVSAICSQDFSFGKKLGELYLSRVDFNKREGQLFPLYVVLCHYASGDIPEAKRIAMMVTQRMNASDWPYPIAMYQAGQIASDELLKMAGSRNAEEMAAHCHIAIRESAEGDYEQALISMGLVFKSRYDQYVEYTIIDSLADHVTQKAETLRRNKVYGNVGSKLPKAAIDPTVTGKVPGDPGVTYEQISPETAYADAERAFEVENWEVAAAEYRKAFELVGDRTPDKIRLNASNCALLSGNRDLAEKLVSTPQPRAEYQNLYYPINLFALATILGNPDAAKPFLEDALRKADSDYWPHSLIECCLQKRDFSDLLKESGEYSDRHDILYLTHGFYLLSKEDWRGGLASFYEGTDQLGEVQSSGYEEWALHAASLRVFDQLVEEKKASGELKLPSAAALAAAVPKIRFYRHEQFPKLIIKNLKFKKLDYCGGSRMSALATLDWENSERYPSGRPMGWGSEELRYIFELDAKGNIIGGRIGDRGY